MSSIHIEPDDSPRMLALSHIAVPNAIQIERCGPDRVEVVKTIRYDAAFSWQPVST